MSEDDSTSQITTSGRLVRFFVAGLPWGLVLMGALSFVFYFNKKNKPDVSPTEFAAVLRKDLNATDQERYQRILGREIGARTLGDVDNLLAAAAFMESTLGPSNMGYSVLRQDFNAGKTPLQNVIVPLLGRKLPGEAVLVVAPYDTKSEALVDESAAPAAMLGLAHSLAGDVQGRTIVFLATVNVGAERDDANGLWQAAQDATIKDLKLSRIIALLPDEKREALRLPVAWREVPVDVKVVNSRTSLDSLREAAAAIKQAAN